MIQEKKKTLPCKGQLALGETRLSGDMMDQVQELLQKQFQDGKVELTKLAGRHDHLGILVASNQFQGMPLIRQHQMIMDLLRDLLREKLHAVKIKTMTYDAYTASM